jgi:hypothetical protein
VDTKKTRYLALLLLLLFTGVVVSPVSSVAPSETAAAESHNAIESQETQPDIFMLDLFLWGVLKQGRHSDYAKSLRSPSRRIDTEKEVVSITSHGAAENPLCPLAVFKTNRPTLIDCLSADLATRLAYSDVSPPLLS